MELNQQPCIQIIIYKYTLLLNTKDKTLQSDKMENDILQQAIISLKRLQAVSLKTKIAKK